jgi:hypothetical protein
MSVWRFPRVRRLGRRTPLVLLHLRAQPRWPLDGHRSLPCIVLEEEFLSKGFMLASSARTCLCWSSGDPLLLQPPDGGPSRSSVLALIISSLPSGSSLAVGCRWPASDSSRRWRRPRTGSRLFFLSRVFCVNCQACFLVFIF